ncbi:MAG: LysR substrate-binding domain-containing protein [Woeseiaceae bacterium]
MPNSSKVSLRGLRTFCVAARYESFRTAGEELFITASAVSYQIKSLEEELGEHLFDRNSRELKLTETGQSLYDEVSPLIEQLDAATAKYRKGAVSSSIRISVQPFFASEYFVPRLSEFTAKHPEIDIQVGTSDESSEKHPTDADLSIRLFRSPPANMPSNLLFPLRMAPAGSPEFKKALRVRKKKIVSEFPIVVHESHPKAWKKWAKSAGIELPENSKVTRLDSMIAVVRAAQRGIGAALVPVPIGELWFTEGSVVRLFKEEYVADVSYYLVCTEDRADDESVSLLRQWIVSNFAESV